MKSNTTTEVNAQQPIQEQHLDLLGLIRKIGRSRKLILNVCAIGAVVGLIIAFSIPKEYTANILIAPESNSKKSPSSSVNALAAMAGVNLGSSSGTDAIYPSLYPDIVNSTPFLTELLDLPVHAHEDNTVITLAEYMKMHQKSPWWKSITSAPSRLISCTISLFKDKPKAEMRKKEIDIFRLTPEEAGLASAISSRITIVVEKKTLVITIGVTMQDPLIAATVADSVRTHLQEYVTEYRTGKARMNLEYAEKLYNEAYAEYCDTQIEYARYADANQGLVMQRSRAELERLQNEKTLAYTIYNQVNQQMRLARAKVEEITPVYTIIQPALVPLRPSKPNKMIIIVGCIFLSGVGSTGWVLVVKDLIKRKKQILHES